mmetsp:Transcript_28619/g.52239  ORF Transcript_28619/g.52239 Transcript_28619/m.52239 type:complete len:100 (+) Transcript_28619:1736-2035(+)
MRSLSESKAEVASSSNSTFGFFTRARAIATLCFWPPESCAPPSPTSVSYPFGNDCMKLSALAAIAAASISFCVALGKPRAMFLPMEPEKSVGSWLTIPI